MVTHTTVLGAVISFGLLAVPASGAPAALVAPEAAAAAAGQRLGGIDMPRACREQYAAPLTAGRVGNSCNDWRCSGGYWNVGVSFDVDTPAACRSQYGSNVYAWCDGGWTSGLAIGFRRIGC